MNTQAISIERVRSFQIVELQAIGKRTFFESFSSENTEEDMKTYLTEKFSLEQLGLELNNPHSAFYFAKIEQEIIGYLKVNTEEAQTAISEKEGFEIERIYVLKPYHGKKGGQLLCNKALEIAKEKKAAYVWLGVWEKNPRAIRFYEKNGFVEFDKHIFVLGSDVQTDIMMKLQLV